ncbi:MAG: TlpA disulfide reductase family protein [Bacteroidota bacterium]
MNRFLFFLLLCLFACNSETKETVTTQVSKVKDKEVSADVKDIELEVYDYEGLKPFLNADDGAVHIVNFWATWCAPCIKELPYFEKINSEYSNSNVKVLLVSLDFPKQYDAKLKPFIKKRDLQSKVVAFDDVDQNTWIPGINKDWSGALPATIIYKGDQRKFYEGSLTYEELEQELKQFL